jgi:hypothetical protein
LAGFLRGVVNQLCTPSLTIRKLAQTPGDSNYTPAPGWEITATPTVAGGGTYEWILPDTEPAQAALCGDPADPDDQAPRTCTTNSVGLASFQWEPDPSDADTSAVVTEALEPGYTAGRPAASDWTCTLKSADGGEETLSGEFGTPALGFTLDVDPEQIITCNMYNSFDYEPEIALVKVDDPTQVRGDLPNTITSTFTVTNPGNTPLSDVAVTDDRCTPVFVSGDTNGDGLLAAANAESWIFACTRGLTRGRGSPPQTVTNSAQASGIDPTGERVTADDDATVAVYVPAIELTKAAAPIEVEVGVATAVTYTYVATNTGNMTLTGVTVTDVAGPDDCSPVTPASVATLAPGASATFTCTATLTAADPTATFDNTADVTGAPVFPDGTPAPPAVTDEASAVVTAFQTGIELTKVADRDVVFPGTDVTYTYTVTNTGSVDLVRTDPPPAPPADPRDGWIVDTLGPTGTCTDVDYVSGDLDDDEILDAAGPESWIYTCTTTISGAVPTVRNTASVVAQTVDTGTTLTAFAPEVVEVVRAAIELEKAAVRPVVLDPDAPALGGPDVPLRTPAVYEYLVHNTGLVPIRDVVLDDVYPSQGGNTCPVEGVPAVGVNVGDVNANGLLDPGESWEFLCVLTSVAGGDPLEKTDADDPPGFDPLAPSPVTNTAVASGEAFVTDGTIEQTLDVESSPQTETVHVISPAISLTKTPCLTDSAGALVCSDDLVVRPGTLVTYQYLVANTGDSPLSPIFLVDDRCEVITFVDGDANADGVIDGGSAAETWELRCTEEANLPSPVDNSAAVLASDPLGNTYGSTDDATVRIFEPAIDLTKSVSEELVPAGSEVTYIFEVTNTGTVGLPADRVLANILLADVSSPANPSCRTPAFVGGDDNGNGLLDLDPAETWTYECTGIVNVFTIDVAAVRGTDIQDGNVFAFDTAAVTPFTTGIAVTKTAAPTLIVGSGPVTYSYVVTNTGNVPLADVTGRVTDDTCPDVQPVEVGGFNAGDVDQNDLLTGEGDIFETGGPEEWQFTCTIDVSETTVNTVTAIGTPVRPGVEGPEVLDVDVTAPAQAEVVVVDPGTITIVKEASPQANTGFSFAGSGPIGAFSLFDDGGTGDRRTFSGLPPGGYDVTEDVPSGWRIDAISCVDPSGDTTIDVAAERASIELGAGEAVTCTFRNVQRGSLPATGLGLIARLVLLGFVAVLTGRALLTAVKRRTRRA